MHAADYIGVVENSESTLNSPTASHSFFQNLRPREERDDSSHRVSQQWTHYLNQALLLHSKSLLPSPLIC